MASVFRVALLRTNLRATSRAVRSVSYVAESLGEQYGEYHFHKATPMEYRFLVLFTLKGACGRASEFRHYIIIAIL